MLYAIIATDAPGSSAARAGARAHHLQCLQALRDEGRLLLAGDHPALDGDDPGPAGFTGTLVVAEFDSLEAAHCWTEAEPYAAAGVYAAVQVKPLCRPLP